MLEHVLSKARRILKDAQQKFSVKSAAAVEQVYNDIVNLNDFIGKELAALEANAALDEIGKKKARRGVIEQAGRKFEVIKAQRNYSAQREALEAQLVETPDKESESVLKFLREREVRDRLLNMTEMQILSLFGETLFDGSNPLLMDAILNAPTGFELVSEDSLKRMRRTRARKIFPEISAELDAVGDIHSTVEKLFSLVKKELDGFRRQELPASLTKPKMARNRPFKF
jgi:hypothetical protein